MFGFTMDTTILSYVPKKNRCVILLFTLLHDGIVDEEKERKPEVILYYNQTKGGVDNLNKLRAIYMQDIYTVMAAVYVLLLL